MSIEPDHRSIAPIVGPDDERHFTDSGIEIKPLYDESDLPGDLELGEPGQYPFTRGVHREMYRKQQWTMRQYAGYATAKECNERYRFLIDNGSTGLSMAFDLPTQLGLDSDDRRCLGEVGRTGVAIDSIADMRIAFDRIPLDKVSTSMTINAPASVLLLLYQLVGEEQGVPSHELRGTTQNDILKEYMARGNFIYPPEGSMRLTTDLFEYCRDNVPKWNTISISGYHFREKGCSAVQEVAFTLSNGIAYVQAALDAGLEVDAFAPRLAFFFNGHNNVFQEVAKFRAARGCGRRSCASASARRTSAHCGCGSTPRPAESRSPPSSRRTTSPASRSRVSPRFAAAPSRCTPTASTRPWRCRPRKQPGSPCAPSRSSPPSPAQSTPSTRSPGPTSSSR